MHTVAQHEAGGECKGCDGQKCSFNDTILHEAFGRGGGRSQTPEARLRRKRQWEGEEPYTDEESEDDLELKPERKNKRKDPEASAVAAEPEPKKAKGARRRQEEEEEGYQRYLRKVPQDKRRGRSGHELADVRNLLRWWLSRAG